MGGVGTLVSARWNSTHPAESRLSPTGFPSSLIIFVSCFENHAEPCVLDEPCVTGLCYSVEQRGMKCIYICAVFVRRARRALLQMVEDIADVAGLRALGGLDCQQRSSDSSKPGSPPSQREHTQSVLVRLYIRMRGLYDLTTSTACMVLSSRPPRPRSDEHAQRCTS